MEMVSQRNDAPRLTSATVLEEGLLRARRVPDADPNSAFRAFIDGTQRSSVATYVGNVAVVLGQVAAVVRERRDRRLCTWREPLMESRIYAPRAYLPSVTWNTLVEICGDRLVDITEGAANLEVHPFALRDITVQKVQSHRDAVERRLAERWIAEESDPVFIDGGISGSATVATSEIAVGVVKSHFTLYVKGDALDTVLSLEQRERSSVFRIDSSTRPAVASWYLRLRDPSGHDPMWGLVRVEVANRDATRMESLGARADEISRWVLAEVSPLALPDSRWDKMVYGVRDCEEFLRAVQ
ncbi:MAG: hypothetical protein ABIT20_09370 [Gemmatimonadaceae bacterium]